MSKVKARIRCALLRALKEVRHRSDDPRAFLTQFDSRKLTAVAHADFTRINTDEVCAERYEISLDRKRSTFNHNVISCPELDVLKDKDITKLKI